MNHFVLGSRYYFSRLSDFEQKIYREIYDSWVNGGNVAKVYLPGFGFNLPSGMELHQIVTYIIEDNPHLFHLETSQFSYRRLGGHVYIEAEQVYSPGEYQQIYQKLIKRVNQLTEKAKQYKTDYEKMSEIFNIAVNR